MVQEGIQEGFQFMARLRDEYINGSNRFDQYGEALYIALSNNEIDGVCGLNIDPYLNDKNFGSVCDLYVLKKFQKQGIAKLLVKKVVQEAANYYKVLVLRTNNPIVGLLYCSIGFSNQSPFDNTTHCLQLSN